MVGLCAATAHAGASIFGGPTFSTATGGFTHQSAADVIDGQAIANGRKIPVGGGSLGTRAFRFNSNGNVEELALLSIRSDGTSQASVQSINSLGIAAGAAGVYHNAGTFLGNRAVRWHLDGSITELEHLNADLTGYTQAAVNRMNDAGMMVGGAFKCRADGSFLGNHPVRWNTAGQIFEMQILGTDAAGYYGGASVTAINDAGFSVGYSAEYFLPSTSQTYSAVRWDPSGQITRLQGLHPTLYGESAASDINNANEVVGLSPGFASNGGFLGEIPVRWDPTGAVAQLETLGTDGAGKTGGNATTLNDTGESAGVVMKYDVSHNYIGLRPVRWDAAGHVTELAILGTSITGTTTGEAFDINAAGDIVGYVQEYDSFGQLLGERAMFWGSDGSAIRLVDLVEPSSGWVNLTRAYGISNGAWVSGYGLFDPDGIGPEAAYQRAFLMHVPEPGCLTILSVSLLAMRARPRFSR